MMNYQMLNKYGLNGIKILQSLAAGKFIYIHLILLCKDRKKKGFAIIQFNYR